MFLEHTLALKNRFVDRFSVYFVMSREPQATELLNGRIDGDKLRQLAQHIVELKSADEYLICGPGGMLDEVRDAIKLLKPDATIRFERFANAAQRPAATPAQAAPGAAAARGFGDDHDRHGRSTPHVRDGAQ